MNDCRMVLIADDDELFRETAADLLRKARYAVDCAAGPAEASRKLSENRYDALISDIKMPGDAELQFILEARESSGGLPIILVTGCPSLETAIEAVRLSIVAYLIKPVGVDELLAVVGAAVARSCLYRMAADLRARLKRWDDDASQLERVFREHLITDVATSAQSLLRVPLEMIGEAAVDLHRLAGMLAATAAAAQPQKTPDLLSRLDLCAEAIRQTVDALEQSKYVFKSKRLKELRQQLQGLLGVLEQPAPA